MILGPILTYLTVVAQSTLGTSGATSALIVVVLGFTMTIAQSISLFEVVTAIFIGGSIYFASGNLFHSIVITSMGLILGLITMKLTSLFDSIILGERSKKEEIV